MKENGLIIDQNQRCNKKKQLQEHANRGTKNRKMGTTNLLITQTQFKIKWRCWKIDAEPDDPQTELRTIGDV